MNIHALVCLASLALSSARASVVPVAAEKARQLVGQQSYQLQASVENPDIVYINQPQDEPIPEGRAYITQGGLVYAVPSLRDSDPPPPAPQPGYIETIYNWLTGAPAAPAKPIPGPTPLEPQPPSSESQPPAVSHPSSESQSTVGAESQETPSIKTKPESNVAAEGTDQTLHKPSPAASAAITAKLEQLEPEAELLPGVQQEQEPRQPAAPSQPPLLPGLGGLPPYYIVQQPHLYGQHPIYSPLPFHRPPPNFPGGYQLQRFYIVNPQTGYSDNYAEVQGQHGVGVSKFGIGLSGGAGDIASLKRGSDPIAAFAPASPDAPPAALPFYGYNQAAQHQLGLYYPVDQGSGPIHFSQYVYLQQRPGAGDSASAVAGAPEKFSAPLDRKSQFMGDFFYFQNGSAEPKPNKSSETQNIENRSEESPSGTKAVAATLEARKEDDRTAEEE